jgi:hypothetical protein
MPKCLGKRKDGQPCAQRCVRFCRWHTTSDLCSICLEQPNPVIKLNCGHSFCEGCIYNWIFQQTNNQSFCPMCRTEIDHEIKTDSYNWGHQQGILDRTGVWTWEISDESFIKLSMSPARVFIGKLLTWKQFEILLKKLPKDISDDIIDNNNCYNSDLYFFKDRLPLEDYYTIN